MLMNGTSVYAQDLTSVNGTLRSGYRATLSSAEAIALSEDYVSLIC